MIAVLVFGVCAVLTMITFRQFNRHQDNYNDDPSHREPEAILIDTGSSTSTTRYKISEKPVMIGRVEANDNDIYDSVVVPDVTVGRRHAVIEYDDGVFWLQDQGSVNGSFVNGRRIEERHRLREGDIIKIHKFPFQFVEQFVFGQDHVNVNGHRKVPSDFTTTMPQIVSSFDADRTMRPNDVLQNHAQQNADILEIPRHKKEAEVEHQRTQVLYRNEMEEEFSSLQHHLLRERPVTEIQEMTVQLFMSPNDDKTTRLYSELLDRPPENRPDYEEEEKKVFSQMSLLPDMDEKVMEALGEFFNETDDDDFTPQLEMTKKGDRLAQAGNFSSQRGSDFLNKETWKG
jgi:pSer/pThr/pTyr-binding forkhead associated (FHA) protein